MRIGIMVAMDSELQLLLSLFHSVSTDRRGGYTFFRGVFGSEKEVIIVCGGIGKVSAALCAAALIDYYSPAFILSTGVAGAAQTDILPLQVVVSEQVAYYDVYCGSGAPIGQVQGFPRVYTADKGLLSIARSIPEVRCGMITTGDWFVENIEKAQEILRIYPAAIAFDMESSAVAQVCHMCAMPFIAMRVISDNPLLGASQQQYDDFWTHLAEGSFRAVSTFLHIC